MEDTKPKVTIYTSGANTHNPGPAGCAVVLLFGGHRKELIHSIEEAYINVAELEAVVLGLSALKAPCQVTVVTGNRSVIGWLSQGWKRRTADVRAKVEAIEALIASMGHEVWWEYIARETHLENVRANGLARQAAEVPPGA